MKLFFVKILCRILRSSKLGVRERGLLINSLMGALNVLPLHEIIMQSSDGSILVNGKVLEREQQMAVSASAKRDLSSKSLALVNDQVLYQAMHFAVTGSVNFEQIYAGKMAVWWGTEQRKLLALLAGMTEEEPE